MKRFLFDCGTRDATASLGLFALRVMTGLMMLVGHGIPKIEQYATLKNLEIFSPVKFIPSPIGLILCIGAEVGAAALIVLGLATRPAAFVLGFNMVVAAFGVLGNAPWFMAQGVPAAKEPALLYLIPLIAVILSGAGAWSLDASIHREGKRRRW